MKVTDFTSEQQTQLIMLFSQQDILNEIILNYNKNLELNKKGLKNNDIQSIVKLMKSIVDDINEKQFAIDTNIKQIQNDIGAKLN